MVALMQRLVEGHDGLALSILEALPDPACAAPPLVIFIHGFPDTAAAFAPVLPACASQGWHAVSLETRGLPPSELPANGDYSLPTLAADVAATITALGHEQAVLVGHDWGAVIGAAVGADYPERLTGLALVGFPHLSQVKVTVSAILQRPHHLLFQFGALGRWLTGRRDLAYLDRMYRVWSPSWQVPAQYLERVKQALRPPQRLAAALQYYVQIWQRRKDQAMLGRLAQPLQVPGLVIGGRDEPAFRQRWLAASTGVFAERADLELWPGVGHWPHTEAPLQFEQRILKFLRRCRT